MIIRKKFQFEASHQLPDYDGPCARNHGHSFELWVGVEGQVDEKTGMIIDFKDLKRIVNELVIDKFDHQHLNDIIPNPTAENILSLIVSTLEPAFDELGLNLIEVEIAETAGNEVIWC